MYYFAVLEGPLEYIYQFYKFAASNRFKLDTCVYFLLLYSLLTSHTRSLNIFVTHVVIHNTVMECILHTYTFYVKLQMSPAIPYNFLTTEFIQK